jgi:S-adenosylmethionine-diacylglycerol 3-amino-3-carboxypropyl transferase
MKPHVRWLTSKKTSLYGLGIPPAQYEALARQATATWPPCCALGCGVLPVSFP